MKITTLLEIISPEFYIVKGIEFLMKRHELSDKTKQSNKENNQLNVINYCEYASVGQTSSMCNGPINSTDNICEYCLTGALEYVCTNPTGKYTPRK